MTASVTKRADAGTVARTDEDRRVIFAPSVDVGETADEYVVVVSLPGTSPEDVDVTVADDKLEVHASVQPRDAGDLPYVRREYAVGDFSRTFDLEGCDLDGDGFSAEYEHGVLTVRLPKAEEARPRRIPIKSASK